MESSPYFSILDILININQVPRNCWRSDFTMLFFIQSIFQEYVQKVFLIELLCMKCKKVLSFALKIKAILYDRIVLPTHISKVWFYVNKQYWRQSQYKTKDQICIVFCVFLTVINDLCLYFNENNQSFINVICFVAYF